MICCFTGHRYFSWGENAAQKAELLISLKKSIDIALSKGATHFICGNAVGVDTWAAQLILTKKEQNPEIFLEIAVPFQGHNAGVAACQNVQQKADFVHVASNAKSMRQAFYERNRYMVDISNMIIAVYEESRHNSGTLKTLRYAENQGLEIIGISV